MRGPRKLWLRNVEERTGASTLRRRYVITIFY